MVEAECGRENGGGSKEEKYRRSIIWKEEAGWRKKNRGAEWKEKNGG